MTASKTKRDGFSVRAIEDGKEVDFIRCEKDGRLRERVERGLLMRIDAERFYVADTRDDADDA